MFRGETHNVELPRLKEMFLNSPYVTTKPIKLLIVNVAGIGDFMESIQGIYSIRQYFPHAEIYLIVTDKVYSYARLCPYVDKVFSIQSHKGKVVFFKGLNKQIEIIKSLRKIKFDFVINLYEVSTMIGAIKMAMFLRLFRSVVYLGRDTNSYGFFYNRKVSESTLDKFNQRYYYNKLIQLLGIKKDVLHLSPIPDLFWFTDSGRKKVKQLLADLSIKDTDFVVGINPGSDRKTRECIPKNFAEVADFLIKNYGSKVIILGSEKDISLAETIKTSMSGKPYILCGKINIEELILLIKRCNLVISTNSAAMHISGLIATPVVGIIGPGNPYRDAPSGDKSKIRLLYKSVGCNPCDYYECPKKDKICMEISPKEIIESAKQLIGQKQEEI